MDFAQKIGLRNMILQKPILMYKITYFPSLP